MTLKTKRKKGEFLNGKKKLIVSEGVKLHIEQMLEVLAGEDYDANFSLPNQGCGEQCMITCAHYCKS